MSSKLVTLIKSNGVSKHLSLLEFAISPERRAIFLVVLEVVMTIVLWADFKPSPSPRYINEKHITKWRNKRIAFYDLLLNADVFGEELHHRFPSRVIPSPNGC